MGLIECFFCCCRAIKRARNSFFVLLNLRYLCILLEDLAYQFRWSLVD